jgi:methionyl-tRNA formyltransferase
MKIIFFGTPYFAMPVLEELKKNNYEVIHFKSKNLKNEEIFKDFKSLNPEICVVAAYGKIIPKQYLEISKYGFLNIHPSLLPKYRGPSPIQTAILNGDKEIGITIMIMDEQVDHGPLLASQKFSIENFNFSNHDELAKELFTIGAKLLIKILPQYIKGEIKPEPQDHTKATYTKIFKREDSRINWNEPAEKIYNKIRAFNPEPGAWTTWKGKILNIKKARMINGKIEIEILQLEGKKETPLKEFINGYPDFDISQLN